MDREDGQAFVKSLASFVRTHERALANALQSQRGRYGQQQSAAGASSAASSISATMTLSEALSRPHLPFMTKIKPAKLSLTPHHLYYLLSKFEDLGVDIGSMTIRLENLQQHGAGANYTSFLHAPRTKGKQADAESLRSVSSVRSVMSSMSTLWSSLTLSNSAAKTEKMMAQYREDIRYLYSCFTKIPALRLAPDHRARLIDGFEQFPFDTAVPLFAFKNISALEICDLDFRQFHGWDRLSEQLRSLTVRRAHVDDPIDLLKNIVLDDMEKRRKRSSKTIPVTPSTPAAPWPTNSARARQIELARAISAPDSPFNTSRRGSRASPGGSLTLGQQASLGDNNSSPPQQQRQRSSSPPQTPSSRHGSLRKHARTSSMRQRRSSGSSGSTDYETTTPRRSMTDLLALGILPSSKWCFLRHLSLIENGLTSLTASSLAPVASTLQSLDLSKNLFTEVPDALASLTNLRALNLSDCMINSLQSLTRNPLPGIVTLNLHSNRLENLSGIERVLSLERVDVRDNRLRDPMELARLVTLPELVEVYVIKNPFTRTHSNFRVTIFNAFRKAAGRTEDISIDRYGPQSHEKKFLVDRVPEPPYVPVVKPPFEDERVEKPQAIPDGAPAESELRALEMAQEGATARRRSHRRATSDLGPLATRQKRRPPRRKLVDLSQADSPTRTAPAQQVSSPEPRPALSPNARASPIPAPMVSPDLTPRLDAGTTVGPPSRVGRSLAPVQTDVPIDMPALDTEEPPKTPTTDSDQPSTPGETPAQYHTAPTTQAIMKPPALRPLVETTLLSPTPAPKIRDPSDDDSSPTTDPHDMSHSNTYRKKIEALKSDLGTDWLAALNDNRMSEQKAKRGFSPASRASTIRGDHVVENAAVVPAGRTLG